MERRMKKAIAAKKEGSKFKKETTEKEKEISRLRKEVIELKHANTSLNAHVKELKEAKPTPSITNSAPKQLRVQSATQASQLSNQRIEQLQVEYKRLE